MTDLLPLLARNRYSDEEWEHAVAGRCGRCVEFGNGRGVVLCGQPSSPASVYRYCGEHDDEAREDPVA